MTDFEWMVAHGVCFFEYDFAERVGMILDDDAIKPSPEKLEAARWQAARELRDERKNNAQ